MHCLNQETRREIAGCLLFGCVSASIIELLLAQWASAAATLAAAAVITCIMLVGVNRESCREAAMYLLFGCIVSAGVELVVAQWVSAALTLAAAGALWLIVSGPRRDAQGVNRSCRYM